MNAISRLIFQKCGDSAHYHFVSRWTSSSAYIAASLVMMVFVSRLRILVSMQMRCIFKVQRLISPEHEPWRLYLESIHFSLVFADRLHYNVIALLSAPDLCVHRRAPTDVRIQHDHHIPSGTSAHRHLGPRR